MATARKLKSGSWRCLVYDYTDADGKRKEMNDLANKHFTDLCNTKYNTK